MVVFDTPLWQTASQQWCTMQADVEARKALDKTASKPVPLVIPIPAREKRPIKGAGHLPRSAWRALHGKTVEQMKAASKACPTCHLPMKAMKLGGLVQKCRCKKVNA